MLAQRRRHRGFAVGLALRQALRQADVDQVGLEEELAASFAMAGAIQGDAFGAATGIARRHVGGERVEVTAHLAGVPCHLRHAALVSVELLERDHRQVDVVLLEAEQRRRVVHEHVGVEDEQRRRAIAAWALLLALRTGRQRGSGRSRRLGHGGRHRCRRQLTFVRQLEQGRGDRLGRRSLATCPLAGGTLRFERISAQEIGALGRRLGQRYYEDSVG